MACINRVKNPSFSKLNSKDYGRPPQKQHESLQDLTRPHVESFNYVAREGLAKAIKHITPVEFGLPNGDRVELFFQDAAIARPMVSPNSVHARTLKVFPSECRERATSYQGRIQVALMWRVNGRLFGPEERSLGEVPIMVKSELCNLDGMSPKDLVTHGEEAEEMGGYFIINGYEKVIRMLVMQRRNFPIALIRPSWKNRGKAYTEYGVQIRCVMEDQTSSSNVLHYLNNGSATFCFMHWKEQFFVPVIMILKGLVNVSDQHIYTELVRGKEDNSFYKGCIANMLRLLHEEGLGDQKKVLKYIGERFGIKLHLPDWYTNLQVAEFILKICVCPHLANNKDKFHLIVHMTQKLFTFAKGECAAESPDNPMFQEALLGGHLFLMVLKEKLETWLLSLRAVIERKARNKGPDYSVTPVTLPDAIRHVADVTKSMSYLLSTGNLVSRSGLGLMQNTGLTVLAEKLNFYRYISHFRCIHRGAFFSEMRTTAVRRLLPEAWGFLCPVHTPDGSPCGLLNHLSALCQLVNSTYNTAPLQKLLLTMGMCPRGAEPSLPGAGSEYFIVMLDGVVLGWLHERVTENVADQLRVMKVKGLNGVPRMLEVCYVAKTKNASQFPGLFLFTSTARMMRPVINLALNEIEMIGTFEQLYLNVCLTAEEAQEGVTTHMEVREDSMLSAIASLTPFSDFNQSPRNMYQCQMGKQTMGTPLHAYEHRADNKLYRILSPQTPIVRPGSYDHYNIDEYPLGTNAIVAVISYTGYDMEDAMVINKSSYERGFCHGCIYKSETINLKKLGGDRGRVPLRFGCLPTEAKYHGKLDTDGLPPIGTRLENGAPMYSYINVQTGVQRTVMYKGTETAYVQQVKILGDDTGQDELQNAVITLRIVRNPIIGDKFSSRHGQKGICSQKWPVEDMPFSESGMTPDIIFNPHGFPSRMTIGMMIESMAGKSGAMHGMPHDATPFSFSEDTPAIDHFGKMLTAAGYNYHGNERLYSGVDGREFEADIFMGVVYYQRLRHMVSDKFQVRTTGPIDVLTHQPLKGRKRMGGVRFGEMERDGLLAHGTSFLLEDRLLNCSDKCISHVCQSCGSILSPLTDRPQSASMLDMAQQWKCNVCERKDTVRAIAVPYVFCYLVAELAAMNIKVDIDVKEC